MGTVCWGCERTGPAAGVALGRPANRVAWRSLKDAMLYKNSKKKLSGNLKAAESWILVLESLLQSRRHALAPFCLS